MHFSLLSVAAFAGLAVAQFAGLPTCAQDCASQQFTGGSYAGCGTDPKCICSNEAFISNIACCLVGACDAADQASAVTFAQQICTANGVSVPSVVSCATATTAQSTAAASGTAASATATATATKSSASGSAAASTSGSASQAWAPRQTAAMGMEMLGLAAAGLVLW